MPMSMSSRFMSLSLWNANGLKQSVMHDVLSHVLDTHVLLVTETWLTSGSFPTDWSQYHLYGSKVPGAFNRSSGGITVPIRWRSLRVNITQTSSLQLCLPLPATFLPALCSGVSWSTSIIVS
ncbi:hypothetical protein G6F42_012638 [Rhizopus arrhizus]|nr:hypothetical protein G6F42_012638 [Rhizopus arrhizus]